MTSVREIDAVVFDIGQVLIRWDPYRPYEGRYERAEVDAFFDEIDFPAFNHLQDAGRSWADARSALSTTAPHRVAMLDVYVEHFADSLLGEVEGAADLVAELRDLGIRVLGLTNWSAESFEHAPARSRAVAMLEDVLVSGREGRAKPDPAVFELAVERFRLDPRRTLFTDDAQANVDSAAGCGFRVHAFVGTDDLRDHLRGLGVPVRAPDGHTGRT